MVNGIFRGTCEFERFSEMVSPDCERTFYMPEGGFIYGITEEVGMAYIRALDFRSTPIVACLLDDTFLGDEKVPDSAVRFFEIGEVEGLGELVDFYQENRHRIPAEEQENAPGESCLLKFEDYTEKLERVT